MRSISSFRVFEQFILRLITIYTDYPDEKPPFPTDCYIYHETIGFEKDLPVLKEIVSILLDICNMTYRFSESEWNRITQNAYLNSRRRTTNAFVKMVAEKHPTIKVEGEYTGSWNKIQVRCMNCGSVWLPTANNLLRGHGCRHCASIENGKNKKKQTEHKFLSEIARIKPSVIVLSYESSTSYVFCKCRQCGHQWKSLPSSLLKRKRCPHCLGNLSIEE